MNIGGKFLEHTDAGFFGGQVSKAMVVDGSAKDGRGDRSESNEDGVNVGLLGTQKSVTAEGIAVKFAEWAV